MQLFVEGIRKHLDKENEEFKAKGLNETETFILSNSEDKPKFFSCVENLGNKKFLSRKIKRNGKKKNIQRLI